MNIDAIRTPRGFSAALEFITLYKSKGVMMIVDESHLIKTWNTDRTKASWKLGKLCKYRRILTGTPISKNIIDAWSQYMFLDERILGHKYVTSFRNRYCIMGGWENKQIVGQKNTDEFTRLIQPHSFRCTKEEALDLPPKTYIIRQYEMGDKTRAHYNMLRNTFMTQLDDGEIVDVPNAAVAALRLQQIVCGYLPKEDGSVEVISDERIDVMLEIVAQLQGQVVVWARFTEDIDRIVAALSKVYGKASVRAFYGATKEKERHQIRQDFRERKLRFIAGNPQAGGTGNNFQGHDVSAIYYSNSFKAIDRWQSEDRIHRMGTTGTVNTFDIVAAKSVDRGIIGNLKMKKSISDLTFDEMRQLISS
jgi:SNF2 family DNA or RNA helicase